MKKILITGGTGLIGKQLSAELYNRGYEVSILSRSSGNNSNYRYFTWDIDESYLDMEALKDQDYIIHLAGENLGATRWTKEQKQKILDSRIKSSELVFKKLVESKARITAFISASAIGIYPAFSEGGPVFTENDKYGTGFIAEVCKSWENAADNFKNAGIRTVKIRTGLVQDVKDPALKKILQLAKFGILPVFGKGKQYYPWIHINDLVNIYIEAIENINLEGAVNAVAPDLITNQDYIKAIKLVRGKGLILKIPAFIIKILFSEMSEIILKGTKINSKLNDGSFEFEFPELTGAMEDLLKEKQSRIHFPT
jgi:uncharacterized protein (TIGR01777 family)